MYAVSALAREAGSTVDAVRHYTEIGLLHPHRDRNNNYRRYTQADLKRLGFIRASRELGFSLDDIQRVLADAGRGDSPCPQVRALYERRLREVEQELARLQAQRDGMRRLLAHWRHLPDCAPTGDSICHLIEEAARTAAGGAEDGGRG